MLDPTFERAVGRLRRLFETSAGAIELPTVVRAADSLLIDSAVRERSRAMRTVFADQSIATTRVAINDQLLAENFNRFDRFLFGELRGGGDRMPISAQELAARRAAAYLSQKFIFFACEHSELSRRRSIATFCSTSARSRASPTSPDRNSPCESPQPFPVLFGKSR